MNEKIKTTEPGTNLKKTKQMVLTALLFAVAVVLSIIENTFPPIIVGVPGVKLGLSNIAIMYVLFFLGKKQAFGIAVLKAFFVFITKGIIAGFLSFSGGILSLTVMLLMMLLFKEKISYLAISIWGSVFHNIGQFTAITIIYTSIYIWDYLPVLLISGVFAGIATSTLLKFIFPAFKKLGLK